ncbi:MAG: heavy metal sensor histidine kinase [Chthoniobacterales bacterium]
MSSRSTEPRSIASQLVWLFASSAVLLLCLGLATLYWIVVRHTFEEDNAFLADKVAAIRGDLEVSRGADILREELSTARRDKRAAYWVRIVDMTGGTVAETPGMPAVLPTSIFPNAPTALSRDYRAQGSLFAITTATQEIDGHGYLLQVAQDRSEDAEFMKHFGTLVAIVLAVGAVAAALIAMSVTKRGLLPLAEMTRAVERIGPTHLHERVSRAGWPRELQPLAGAFDDMMKRLEQSFRRLSQFSADLAHELRTPIANIRGEAEVALTRTRTSEEYREVVESTVMECEKLSGVIDSLLFVARAEAAEQPIQPVQFDGRLALEKIAEYYQALAEDRRVDIRCDGNGIVYADEVLFGRAVSNLFENALRHTSERGKIVLSVVEADAVTNVTVMDDGWGIPAEDLPHVFDRFYQVDRARSASGAGLGLALVKSIAELHGGGINIDSEVGKGTQVTISFPSKLSGLKI